MRAASSRSAHSRSGGRDGVGGFFEFEDDGFGLGGVQAQLVQAPGDHLVLGEGPGELHLAVGAVVVEPEAVLDELAGVTGTDAFGVAGLVKCGDHA
ncbi:hypothetical protein JOF29_005792 [Kribbella aluminosa]|uniref:Uncharacterized protein n=1 Tax=Kribbella aluminosa TaxID=416017 RepID=A0ABS4USR5_9ACTN|nr:hypothetical protein [Kribbella aluminosa]MBP2354682.1 hypothetical protein [Kribbella aluminosa]